MLIIKGTEEEVKEHIKKHFNCPNGKDRMVTYEDCEFFLGNDQCYKCFMKYDNSFMIEIYRH